MLLTLEQIGYMFTSMVVSSSSHNFTTNVQTPTRPIRYDILKQEYGLVIFQYELMKLRFLKTINEIGVTIC